jgi:hypothetical protein
MLAGNRAIKRRADKQKETLCALVFRLLFCAGLIIAKASDAVSSTADCHAPLGSRTPGIKRAAQDISQVAQGVKAKGNAAGAAHLLSLRYEEMTMLDSLYRTIKKRTPSDRAKKRFY